MKQAVSGLEPLDLKTKLAYGFGEWSGSAASNIRAFYLLFFLTSVAGLNPSLAGMVLLIGRLWDAVNDPLIGWLSDRTQTPWGRRYPWMILGALPFGALFVLQWLVPTFYANPVVNQYYLFWYYVLVTLLFDAAFTAITLPRAALIPDLAEDYHERTSLLSVACAFAIGTAMVSLVLAQVIFSWVSHPIYKYTVLAAVCAAFSVLSILICIWGTRQRVKRMQHRMQQRLDHAGPSLPLLVQVRLLLRNRPFLLLIGLNLCCWVSVEVTAAMLAYFVVDWMHLPDRHITQMVIVVQGTAMLSTYFWSWVSHQVGKRIAYLLGMPCLGFAQIGLFLLSPHQIGWMYALAVLAGFGIAIAYLIPWSMVPDVIDLDEVYSHQRREGLFYGFMVQIKKLSLALALFLIGQGLARAGYLSTSAEQVIPHQPDLALLTIRLIIGPLPAVAVLLSLGFAVFYPISQEVHAEILLKLRERKTY